jgi:hypothetical protein
MIGPMSDTGSHRMVVVEGPGAWMADNSVP